MEAITKTRELPVFRVCDTDFVVDAVNNELSQKEIPFNTISFKEIGISEYESTEFAFDLHTKNVYEGIIDPDNIPGHVRLVVVPPLSTLDPIAAQKRQHPRIEQQQPARIGKRKRGLRH